jgi:uncharacterized damage-inducible protein DinB
MSNAGRTETAGIADELRRAFDGAAWHGDSLFEILKGVTAAQAAARPVANAHSIWELVFHIATWDGVARRRMTGVAVMPSDEENFPRGVDTSDEAWRGALEHVRQAHEELIAAVASFPETRLIEQVPGKQGAYYNFHYMLHGLAQHTAYHAGQIALLKKM